MNRYYAYSRKNSFTSASIISFVLLTTVSAVTAKPLSLPETQPIPMTFHAFDRLKPGSPEYNRTMEAQAPFPIIHGVGNEQKTKQVKSRWPDKMVILQEAYGGISVQDYDKVWPGHLLYKPGTLVTQNISPQDSEIVVEDSERIAKNNKKIQKINKKNPFALIIYALDDQGKPDWSKAEHVIAYALHKNAISIERGQWGSKPLAFTAGKAVIAPHMMFWSRQWQLNFSLESPRGGAGNLTAAEWYARIIAQRLKESDADGVEFDVARWTWGFPEANPMDVNNDRIADYGYLNGINSFGLGGEVFFRELRKLTGPDKIIQADSNDAIFGIRDWSYINGVQMESFPNSNDFDRFSPAFVHLRLWVDNAAQAPRISYPFTKTPTTVFSKAKMPNGDKTDFRFRVGLASACLTGMPHPFASLRDAKFDPANAKEGGDDNNQDFGVFNWDEYHGGEINNWRWLGRALGVAQQDLSDLDKTDLLGKTQWQWSKQNGFAAELNRQAGVYTANVTQTPANVLPEILWSGVSLKPEAQTLQNLTQGQEYTLEFDAQGADDWRYGGQQFGKVPRMIAINGAITGKNDRPLSVLADSQWRSYRISFIADRTVPSFGVAEQLGKTALRNIKLHAGGAERWSREFENGMVLLNMTTKPWQAKVKNNTYKHLKGLQAPEINSGQAIADTVLVPAHDAVFLVKR